MNCDPSSLLEAARCFSCIPKGMQENVSLYLLCRVAQTGLNVKIQWVPPGAGGTSLPFGAFPDLATFQTFNNVAVTRLDLIGKNLTSLTHVGWLPNLTWLDFGTNNITTFNWASVPNLTVLGAYNNSLDTVDMQQMPNLINAQLQNNPVLTNPLLDATGLASLQIFFAINCNLTTIKLTGCIALVDFRAATNANLTTLTGLATCISLQHIEVQACDLSSLNLTGMAAFIDVICNNNHIGSLDLSSSNGLVNLVANDNQLTSVDLANCTNLDQVILSNNLLNQANVDSILNQIATFTPFPSGGISTIALDGTGNASPTGGVLNPDYVTLTGNGWAVNIN